MTQTLPPTRQQHPARSRAHLDGSLLVPHVPVLVVLWTGFVLASLSGPVEHPSPVVSA
jgi:hypothetical protein